MQLEGVLRGNHGWIIDQNVDTTPFPTSIDHIISNASFKMLDPQKSHTRSLFRSRDQVGWGSCRDPGNEPDPWHGSIDLLVANCQQVSGANTPIYYCTTEYKVTFRGRHTDTVPASLAVHRIEVNTNNNNTNLIENVGK